MTNKTSKTLLPVFVLVSLFALAGCQKVYDYIHLPGHGDADNKTCSIQQITADFDTELDTYVVHYLFSYNRQGNPVSVKNDYIATGNPNLVFKYDKSNRLLQFIRPYANGSYETWNKYGYNSKNQIVRDTQYVFGDFTDSIPQPTPYEFRYTDYKYDGQNRIVEKTDSIFQSPGHLEVVTHNSYSYDSRGNLIVSGVNYDNKINIRRTNKVWMFITRDYSVNNPVTATAYNEYGLPLAFPNAYQALNVIVPLNGKAVVEYSCK